MSVQIHQLNIIKKKRLLKELVKGMKMFLKKRKAKFENMDMSDINI